MKAEETGIWAIGAALAEDTSARECCPFCAAPERSLSVTRRSHRIFYHCFRASCAASGSFPIFGTAFLPTESIGKGVIAAKDRRYRGSLLPLADIDRIYFKERFRLLKPVSIWLSEERRYVFDIYDSHGQLRGYLERCASWKGIIPSPRVEHDWAGGPKTKLYMEDADDVPLAWYSPTRVYQERGLVLVEDCLSAMRVAERGWYAAALLGTYLDYSRVEEIAAWRKKNITGGPVYLALDADATATALTAARKWSGMLADIRVVILRRDLKEERPESLPGIIYGEI